MGFFSAICSGLSRGISKSFIKPAFGYTYHRSNRLARPMNKSSVGHRATYHKRYNAYKRRRHR